MSNLKDLLAQKAELEKRIETVQKQARSDAVAKVEGDDGRIWPEHRRSECQGGAAQGFQNQGRQGCRSSIATPPPATPGAVAACSRNGSGRRSARAASSRISRSDRGAARLAVMQAVKAPGHGWRRGIPRLARAGRAGSRAASLRVDRPLVARPIEPPRRPAAAQGGSRCEVARVHGSRLRRPAGWRHRHRRRAPRAARQPRLLHARRPVRRAAVGQRAGRHRGAVEATRPRAAAPRAAGGPRRRLALARRGDRAAPQRRVRRPAGRPSRARRGATPRPALSRAS